MLNYEVLHSVRDFRCENLRFVNSIGKMVIAVNEVEATVVSQYLQHVGDFFFVSEVSQGNNELVGREPTLFETDQISSCGEDLVNYLDWSCCL